MRLFVWATVVAAVGIVPVSHVEAGPVMTGLGPASSYNVFVFGNATLTNSDIEGRAAVGGNATFSGYAVGSSLSSSSTSPSLVVGGDLKFTNGTVTGPAVVGGSANLTSTTIDGNFAVDGNVSLTNLSFTHTLDYGGTLTKSGVNSFIEHSGTLTTLPVDFAAAQLALTAESAYLGSLSATGTSQVKWSGLWLTGTTPGSQQIFNINASDLTGITYINISALAGQTVIVNIFGTSATFPNIGLTLSGVDAQHLLYNFVNATSVAISSLSGSVLAPLADVTFSPGALNGTLVAKSVTGGGESHNVPFLGTLPTLQADPSVLVAAPEPASLLIFGAGLGSLLVTSVRRGRRSA